MKQVQIILGYEKTKWMKKNCVHCGKEHWDGNQYCPYCK